MPLCPLAAKHNLKQENQCPDDDALQSDTSMCNLSGIIRAEPCPVPDFSKAMARLA
jgi:hypothetical protein